MTELRVTTAGESHGPAEVCVLEGIPAGLAIQAADIDLDLARRQRGYGRGGRMSIETDRCRFLSGVRLGRTLGSPICILVENQDHKNWLGIMSPEPSRVPSARPPSAVTVPRPGHADLSGCAKYGLTDIRDVLERASARETVGRVAAGAVCKRLLAEVGVRVHARVIQIGGVSAAADNDLTDPRTIDWDSVEASAVGCDDERAGTAMCAAIDEARAAGESLGGIIEIWCWGACPGVGGYGRLGERLDGRLLGAVASIPAIKAVELGHGFSNAGKTGSEVHDPLFLRREGDRRWIARETNRAAGLEGGMTTGMPIVVRAGMKPIPTLTTPLSSVDVSTMEAVPAHVERSDVTAVPAARVVGEAMVAIEMARAYLAKFGGDSLQQFLAAVTAYESTLEARGLWRRS